MQEQESFSAEQLYGWIVDAGRLGYLPTSNVMPIAAIKARQKRWRGVSAEDLLSSD